MAPKVPLADEPELSKFQDILDHANALVKAQQPRVRFQNEMRDEFLLKCDDWKSGKPDWVKEMKDPTPFTSVITPVNILSTGEPQFKFDIPESAMPQGQVLTGTGTGTGAATGNAIAGVGVGVPDFMIPHIQKGPLEFPSVITPAPGQEPPKPPHQDLGDKLELMMKLALKASDSRQDMSLVRELCLSGFLFSQPIVKIADLRINALYKKVEKMPDLRGRLPFNYQACTPQTIFSERDAYGPSFVLHRYLRPLREIRRAYPDVDIAKEFKADSAGNVVWCDTWSRDEWCVWIQAFTNDATIDQTQSVTETVQVQPPKKNVLGFIPFAMRTARGTRLFEAADEQLFPLLYAGHESKLFMRMNLFLTVASTLAFGTAVPQWAVESDDPENCNIAFDFNKPNLMKVRTGTKFTQLSTSLNKDVIEMTRMLMQKVEHATIPSALSGQIPGGWGTTAASWLNMVIQGGKLEVVPVQVSVSETLAQAAEITLDYLKVYAKLQQEGLKFYHRGSPFTLTPDQLPEYMDISCNLKADLPQDKRVLMQMALDAHRELLLPIEMCWEIAGVEDKNRAREGLAREKQERKLEQMEAQQPPPGNPPPPPGLGAGAVEENPMPPELDAAAMAQATENMNEVPQ